MEINIVEIKVEHRDATTRRVRKSIGDITELAASIKEHGLMHPIVVKAIEDDKFKWVLIAGERRLRAHILNGKSTIKCSLFTNIDDAEMKICELEENIVRESLTWQEEVEALRQLDELKKKQCGTAKPGSTTGWKISDTAEIVGVPKSTAADDIKLARDLRDNPRLRDKVNKLPKTAAKKIVKQELKAAMLKKQVEMKQLTLSNNLLLGDACDLISTLKDESVHLLLTDPPFGLDDIVKVGSIGSMNYNKLASTNVSTEEIMRKVYEKLLPRVYKKLVPGSHIYVFLGMGWYTELIWMLRKTGFIVDDLPLIWYKRRPSMIAKDIHYTSSYEAVLFGHKPPTSRVLRKPIGNVLSISAIAGQKRVHPLQKPFELLKIFIENSSHVGETVLDCFAGSGATIAAASRLKRSAIGFEMDEGNFYRAQDFLRNESENL